MEAQRAVVPRSLLLRSRVVAVRVVSPRFDILGKRLAWGMVGVFCPRDVLVTEVLCCVLTACGWAMIRYTRDSR